MKKKTILVTGGAGFVGSVLSATFFENGHRVIIADNLSNGKLENIPQGIEFVQMDLSKEDEYKKLDDYSFDVVMHIAAQSSNAISFEVPVQDLMDNQLATLYLLEYCRQNSIKRFLFTSSMSAYGEVENTPTPESECCYPDTFYAVHKLASEHYIRIYAQEYGIKPTIFRLYTTYGYGQNLDNMKQGLLSIYLGYLLKGDELIVKGSGERLRDIVFVDDVVRAMLLSLDNDRSVNQTYNMATGEANTIKKIISELLKGLGKDISDYPIVWEEKTQGDPFVTHGDITKAKTELGWEPSTSATEGITKTLEIYANDK